MDYSFFERRFIALVVLYVGGAIVLLFGLWAAAKIRRVWSRAHMRPVEDNADEIERSPTVLKQPDYPRLKGPEEG
jgi:hypothetical protein